MAHFYNGNLMVEEEEEGKTTKKEPRA